MTNYSNKFTHHKLFADRADRIDITQQRITDCSQSDLFLPPQIKKDNHFSLEKNLNYKNFYYDLSGKDLNIHVAYSIYRSVSSHIPITLSQYVYFTYLLNKKRFPRFQLFLNRYAEYDPCANKLTAKTGNENFINSLNFGNFNINTIANYFNKSERNPYLLLANLCNPNKGFFQIIENFIRDFAYDNFSSFILSGEYELKLHLSKIMLIAGVPYGNIYKATRISFRKLHELIEETKAAAVSDKKFNRGSNKLCLSACDHPAKALFCNIMISFYQMGFRVLHNHNLSTPLNESGRHNSHLIEHTLAIGAYMSGKTIFKRIDFYKPWHGKSHFIFFPSYVEFFSILKLFLEKNCESLVCSDCGTHYVYFEELHNEWFKILKSNTFNTCPYCRSSQIDKIKNYKFF